MVGRCGRDGALLRRRSSRPSRAGLGLGLRRVKKLPDHGGPFGDAGGKVADGTRQQGLGAGDGLGRAGEALLRVDKVREGNRVEVLCCSSIVAGRARGLQGRVAGGGRGRASVEGRQEQRVECLNFADLAERQDIEALLRQPGNLEPGCGGGRKGGRGLAVERECVRGLASDEGHQLEAECPCDWAGEQAGRAHAVPEPSRVEEAVVGVARAEVAERGRARGVDDPRRPVVDGRVDRVAARDAGPRLDDDEGLRRREGFVKGDDAEVTESRPSGGGASVYTVGATSKAGSALRAERSNCGEENRASQVHSTRKGRIPRRSAARRDEEEAECGLRQQGGLGSQIMHRHATGERADTGEGRRTSGLTLQGAARNTRQSRFGWDGASAAAWARAGAGTTRSDDRR